MPITLKTPRNPSQTGKIETTDAVDLDSLVAAMGKRLQAEYIEGAIPYLRQYEPALWAQLESLDQEESLEALLLYERLFFEGLRRYLCYIDSQRQAA